RTLFDSIVAYFKPTEVARHEIERGEHLLTEPLNASTGFYIKASRQIGEWQTRFQKMQIYDTPHYGKLFRLDGFNMTSEKEEFVYHENLVHPALTAHAAPRRVLIIGGGDGGSSEEALKHPSVERVTMVEIDADVIDVAKQHFQAVHNGVFDNPKLRVLVEDGMKFVRDTQEKFDLVTLDLNDPVGPATALYSSEFFQQLRQTLAPGGALTLHLGSPVAQPQRVAELAQRLNSVFRIVRVYIMYIPLYGSLWSMAVCSDKFDPKAFTADEIDRRIDARKLQELKYYNGETHEGVFALPNFVRDLVTPARLKQPASGRAPARLELDAGDQPEVADVDHVARAFERVGGVLPVLVQGSGTLEQAFVLESLQRAQARGAGERMPGVGVTVEQLDAVGSLH